MLLAIDVGNTNIVLGLYRGDVLDNSWRLSTDRNKTADEYGIIIRNLMNYDRVDTEKIEAAILSSVVPPLVATISEMCLRYFGTSPLIVGPGVRTGMEIKYENPKEVGADRIVNAVAAYEKYGGPVIVIDFGTATTFDLISEGGAYLGGAIAPGIGISTEALFDRAAKLPRIELQKPPAVIGKNTVHSMQAGIIFGYVAQVDGIVKRISREIGQKPKVVATGGLADLIASESETITAVDMLLTIEGLRIIYERNRQ